MRGISIREASGVCSMYVRSIPNVDPVIQKTGGSARSSALPQLPTGSSCAPHRRPADVRSLRSLRPCLRFRGGHQRLRLRGMSLVCEGLGAVCDGLGVEGRRMGCPGEDCHSHRRLFATKSPSSYVSGQPLRGTMHDMPMHERVPAQ